MRAVKDIIKEKQLAHDQFCRETDDKAVADVADIINAAERNKKIHKEGIVEELIGRFR